VSQTEKGFDHNDLLEGERELWRNSQWRVTNLALEEVPGGSGYWIAATDVHDQMWPDHMSRKQWVDYHKFMQALTKARELHPFAAPRPHKGTDI